MSHDEPVEHNDEVLCFDPDNQMTEVPLELTEDQANDLQEYIWYVRNALRLSNWDVFVAAGAAREGANASIHPVIGRLIAPLRVAQGWYSRSEEDRRNDIVHEILHLIHTDQTDIVRLGVVQLVPDKTANMIWTLMITQTELMIDHLATTIDKHFMTMAEFKEYKERREAE